MTPTISTEAGYSAILTATPLVTQSDEVDRFLQERGFAAYLETSAKSGLGCPELITAIRSS